MHVFFEYFSRNQSLIEWEKKDDNFEQIVVHINYMYLYQASIKNVQQFLEYVGDHPQDVTKSLALALDSVRLFTMAED